MRSLKDLRDWQTLVGATIGFAALCLTSYVTGCQQRQQFSAQQEAAAQNQQEHADSVRAIFLVEMAGMHAACKSAAAAITSSRTSLPTFLLPPYDQMFDRFLGDIVALTPNEISQIYITNDSYKELQADLRLNIGIESVVNSYVIDDKNTQKSVLQIMRSCMQNIQKSITTVNDSVGKKRDPSFP